MIQDLKLFVIDVDGTMTDGGLYYDENGNETKKFCARDAAGFFALHELSIKVMVLTGRECKATIKRMQEMKVDYLFQNVKNKASFLEKFMGENDLSKDMVGYIGDDLNDLQPMKLCGYIGCPADSCEEVKEIASYVSPINGGHGAVRNIIENLLREKNLWDVAVSKAYGLGI